MTAVIHAAGPDRIAAASAGIERVLLAALARETTQTRNETLCLELVDEGTRIGGLVASTSYGWLLVKLLWVDAGHRGRGHGRALLRQAETWGQDAGCHGAWLDTSNPAAQRFYAAQGYAVFGELRNAPGQPPAGHVRWFMRRSLHPRTGPDAHGAG